MDTDNKNKAQLLEKNFISAVVYLNSGEGKNQLAYFLEKLCSNLSAHFLKYEIICVDDDSEQALLDVVYECKKQFEQASITILHMSYYQGMEMAMNAGRDLAIGDFVMEFDECTWNFPEDSIMKVYKECVGDCDIVCFADEKKDKAVSNLFYKLFNHFSQMQYQLESDNFRILSRRGINRMQSLNKTIPYRKALYANCGLKFKVIHYQATIKSEYKHDKKARQKRYNLALDSLLLFTDIGYRVAATMAAVMASIMVLVAVYTLAVYVKGIAIVGWTTTMLFLTFAFFGLFVILAIVIKYLSLLLNLTFKRQRYLFERIEKL